MQWPNHPMWGLLTEITCQQSTGTHAVTKPPAYLLTSHIMWHSNKEYLRSCYILCDTPPRSIWGAVTYYVTLHKGVFQELLHIMWHSTKEYFRSCYILCQAPPRCIWEKLYTCLQTLTQTIHSCMFMHAHMHTHSHPSHTQTLTCHDLINYM